MDTDYLDDSGQKKNAFEQFCIDRPMTVFSLAVLSAVFGAVIQGNNQTVSAEDKPDKPVPVKETARPFVDDNPVP